MSVNELLYSDMTYEEAIRKYLKVVSMELQRSAKFRKLFYEHKLHENFLKFICMKIFDKISLNIQQNSRKGVELSKLERSKNEMMECIAQIHSLYLPKKSLRVFKKHVKCLADEIENIKVDREEVSPIKWERKQQSESKKDENESFIVVLAVIIRHLDDLGKYEDLILEILCKSKTNSARNQVLDVIDQRLDQITCKFEFFQGVFIHYVSNGRYLPSFSRFLCRLLEICEKKVKTSSNFKFEQIMIRRDNHLSAEIIQGLIKLYIKWLTGDLYNLKTNDWILDLANNCKLINKTKLNVQKHTQDGYKTHINNLSILIRDSKVDLNDSLLKLIRIYFLLSPESVYLHRPLIEELVKTESVETYLALYDVIQSDFNFSEEQSVSLFSRLLNNIAYKMKFRTYDPELLLLLLFFRKFSDKYYGDLQQDKITRTLDILFLILERNIQMPELNRTVLQIIAIFIRNCEITVSYLFRNEKIRFMAKKIDQYQTEILEIFLNLSYNSFYIDKILIFQLLTNFFTQKNIRLNDDYELRCLFGMVLNFTACNSLDQSETFKHFISFENFIRWITKYFNHFTENINPRLFSYILEIIINFSIHFNFPQFLDLDFDLAFQLYDDEYIRVSILEILEKIDIYEIRLDNVNMRKIHTVLDLIVKNKMSQKHVVKLKEQLGVKNYIYGVK